LPFAPVAMVSQSFLKIADVKAVDKEAVFAYFNEIFLHSFHFETILHGTVEQCLDPEVWKLLVLERKLHVNSILRLFFETK